MNRRTLLAAGTGVAATAAWGVACSDGAGHAAPNQRSTTASAEARSARPPSTTSASAAAGKPKATDWTALGKGLRGGLIRPGDADYAVARQLYNTRFDAQRPAAIAYVSHTADITECLAFARRHGTPVAIRNGGHSYAGYSSGTDRLVIDVSRLKSVRTSGGSATIGAGAKLIDVYTGLGAHGVTIPAGSCPTVGISGLTLGGGHGVVSRAYGLTADSLTGATIITADGKTLQTSKSREADLFWALRGAGSGNFGVVTELQFRTHKAADGVSAYLTWPWAKAAAVLRAWQEWGPTQPDEIWSSIHFSAAPGRTPTLSVSAFSLGTYGDLQNALDKLADKAGASAKSVSLRRRTYVDAMRGYAGCASTPTDQCHLPGKTPGRHVTGVLRRETYGARSDFFGRSLNQAGIRALLDQVERYGRKTSGGGAVSVALTALGGAVNRVAPLSTAFVHRRSRMLAQYTASWPASGAGAAQVSWLDSAHAAMRRYASGAAYQNYADASLKDWRKAYYGDAADRLTKLKKRYDPRRLFSFPQAL
ncbi:FAD-binding oxidoreductase [Streptomyces zagrosensis]|uniref:FAD/FMN-containing dehydrogenase n=1 Tax=Streptomyces zagrosensis TaxID=1042984 RepID=A0A7W9QIZ5_9ACTN|nr:FAD-binding oxidoreductase [Streptomyces zagrosensis]MBB5940122.1 FAD/FMN-containing dehydrogenase [Streptomyces zagrosensis]